VNFQFFLALRVILRNGTGTITRGKESELWIKQNRTKPLNVLSINVTITAKVRNIVHWIALPLAHMNQILQWSNALTVNPLKRKLAKFLIKQNSADEVFFCQQSFILFVII